VIARPNGRHPIAAMAPQLTNDPKSSPKGKCAAHASNPPTVPMAMVMISAGMSVATFT
jgi:uncharacterized membrane protein